MGIKHILKLSQSLNKLQSQDPLEWPTAKLICSRIKEEDGSKFYQGAVLHSFNDATMKSCKRHALADLKRLDDYMRDRLELSDVDLLRSILVVLDTRSWLLREENELEESEIDGRDDDDNLMEIKTAFEKITDFFRTPLEAKGADLSSLLDEIEEGSTVLKEVFQSCQRGLQEGLVQTAHYSRFV